MDAHDMTIWPSVALLTVAPASGDVLWDNGPVVGCGGYSNATVGVFGARRTLLDDFEVPAGVAWRLTGFRHLHIWNTLPPGSGQSMEILIRADANGAPGDPEIELAITSYEEEATGRVFFQRDEAESWTTFEAIDLAPGRYWFESTIVGTEVNLWMTLCEVTGSECWVNYEDFEGLESGTERFGLPADLSFRLEGSVVPLCVGDIDADGTVDFEDLLLLLRAWGPCPHHSGCVEDLDGNGTVDVIDLLLLLSGWGTCNP